jgi:hypothetical protein
MLRTLSLGLLVTLAACGQARVIARTQYSGVIELQGDRGKAMDGANSEMAAHCGQNNFTIVWEGEEPVGTNRTYQEQTNGYPQGGQQTTGYETRRPAMAWHVHYQCNNALGPAPMPAYAPAQPQPQPEPPPPPPPAPNY